MRSTWIALFVFVLAAGASAQRKHRAAAPSAEAAPSRQAADQAGIRKLQEQDIAANVNYDADALVALWTDDGVLLAPGHAPISGKAGLRDFYQKRLNELGNAEILSYDEQWQEVRILGDYAYEWGQIQSRRRTGQSKVETSAVFNAMRILKRGDDGSWRIARAIYDEARSATSIGREPTPEGERP